MERIVRSKYLPPHKPEYVNLTDATYHRIKDQVGSYNRISTVDDPSVVVTINNTHIHYELVSWWLQGDIRYSTELDDTDEREDVLGIVEELLSKAYSQRINYLMNKAKGKI